MRLCQLMLIGDAELAGDLFEIAGLLVSKFGLDNSAGRGRDSYKSRVVEGASFVGIFGCKQSDIGVKSRATSASTV